MFPIYPQKHPFTEKSGWRAIKAQRKRPAENRLERPVQSLEDRVRARLCGPCLLPEAALTSNTRGLPILGGGWVLLAWSG